MRKADNLPPSCAVVTKSGNLNFLEPSGPVQACNGTALPLPLHMCVCVCVCVYCLYIFGIWWICDILYLSRCVSSAINNCVPKHGIPSFPVFHTGEEGRTNCRVVNKSHATYLFLNNDPVV